MRKFVIPVFVAFIFVAMLSVPALAQPTAVPVPLPGGTASPRDWDKLAPDGNLKTTAVKADSAILIDANTGKVLFEKDADTRRFPASTTKIMTCLLALDSNKDLSEPVTVGTLPKLPGDASDIDLKSGETMTFEDLLYGLMLESGNDAANAIAMYIADGSVDKFVEMMNTKAKELGMDHTHYMNTNGLHNDNHYTTARDMATLARAAQKYPEFVKIVHTYKYTMAPTNKHPNSRAWENHNRLINPAKSDAFGYEYATGVKTGYTDPALHTLVSSAQKDNVSLVAVTLHDGKDDKWIDSITMFEYGFKFYDTMDLVQLLASQTIPVVIKNAAASDPDKGMLKLILKPQNANDNKAFITDSKDAIDKLKNDPTLFKGTPVITKDTAPIKKDDVIGTVTFSYNGQAVLTCDLLSPRDINEMPSPGPSTSASSSKTAKPGSANNATNAPGSSDLPASNTSSIGSVFIWLGVIFLLLLLALVSIRFINLQRRSKKHRQYNFRQDSSTKFRR